MAKSTRSPDCLIARLPDYADELRPTDCPIDLLTTRLFDYLTFLVHLMLPQSPFFTYTKLFTKTCPR